MSRHSSASISPSRNPASPTEQHDERTTPILRSLADQSLKFLEIVERPRTLRSFKSLIVQGIVSRTPHSTALFSSVFRHVNVLLQVLRASAFEPVLQLLDVEIRDGIQSPSPEERNQMHSQRGFFGRDARRLVALWIPPTRETSARTRPVSAPPFVLVRAQAADGASAFRRSTRSRPRPYLWAADFESLTFLRLRISVPSGRLIRTSTSNPPLLRQLQRAEPSLPLSRRWAAVAVEPR